MHRTERLLRPTTRYINSHIEHPAISGLSRYQADRSTLTMVRSSMVGVEMHATKGLGFIEVGTSVGVGVHGRVRAGDGC